MSPTSLSQSCQHRPIKLRNLISGEQTVDNLHKKFSGKSVGCTESRCLGSVINPIPANAVRSTTETLEQAKAFLDNFYASIKRVDSPAHKTRLAEVEEQLRVSDTYYLKETELIYGAKQAWRNAPRCIGRIQWSKLQVFDARFTTNANEMFEALCNHIKYATNKGSLRSAITILPQRVKSVKNDWRIWNSQLIGYAGYRSSETGQVTGDPANADFTEVCMKLGWKGKGTRFDVLPLVLQAAGGPPQLFPLPEELVKRVKIRHPKHKWFEELGLEWYALPAVANMMLDVGGLQFTAAPFSGWYMVTEIGTRDLGDVGRYNMLETVAQRMGLNTTSNMSLWKDQALVELNLAVLDSFQSAGVTIVDHHTACDTFMTHLSNEQRLRGGCPADWVWLVPPTAGSTTQVFHQEMASYHLLPNYEYLEPVWKNFDWNAYEKLKAEEESAEAEANKKRSLANAAAASKAASPASQLLTGAHGELTPRKLRFKEIARAVKFTSKLFGKALSRRIKATILYATETGKSERFANKLAQTFSCAFNVHLMSMNDYDMTCLEHEALLLIVTSTFGNGDPPENGELFAKHLAAVKLTGDTSPDLDSINSVSTNPFFHMLSVDSSKDVGSSGGGSGFSPLDRPRMSEGNDFKSKDKLVARPAARQQDKQEQATNIRPLSNVRFGVFALGSTAYPHFCAFGRYIDQTLSDLGAESILECTCGDELSGQEKAFNEWSSEVFKIACDVFCLTDTIGPIDERPELIWNPADVRFIPVELVDQAPNPQKDQLASNRTATEATEMGKQAIDSTRELISSKKTIVRNLMNITNKRIIPFTVKQRTNLHKFIPEENLQTLRIDLESDLINPPSSADSENGRSINGNSPQLLHSNSLTNGVSTKHANGIVFEAGDHVGIYPINRHDVVDKLLERMKSDLVDGASDELASRKQQTFDFDQVYTILVKRENMDLTPATPMSATQDALGKDNWIAHDRLPITSIREALTRYLDITNPPNQDFLLILSRLARDQDEKRRLQQMGKNFTIYEAWKNKNVPTLLSLLTEFKSVKFVPALLSQIPQMKPRFYSVSGNSVSLTLGVVRFKTASGELREGLCSSYLNTVQIDPRTYVYGYIRSAPSFHMPTDKKVPMLLISAGTGIAPFRSFWQQRHADMLNAANAKNAHSSSFGRIEMYFGCRSSNYILYRDELDTMLRAGVLSSVNIAFSRPLDCDISCAPDACNSATSEHKIADTKQNCKKMYVQDRLLQDREKIHNLIMHEDAHIYVCGDVAMADGVYKMLTTICNNTLRANERDLARYHEDIFGAKGQMS